MIQRIGFRRVLPLLLTLAHAMLVVFASMHSPDRSLKEQPKACFRYTSYGDDASAWQPMEPAPLSPAQRTAIVLNLPAFVLAIPITLLLFPGNAIGSMYSSLPFVPLVWYGVGRWLDRLLGYIPQPAKLHRGRRRAFALLSTFFLFLSIASITPINHHHRRGVDTYIIETALIVWSGLFLAISTTGSVRRSETSVLPEAR